MLTQSYASEQPDEAASWACLHEWLMREQSYRASHPEDVPAEVTLGETIPARDAGDVCHVCGQIVTWTDHLPPLEFDGAVRCYSNVRFLSDMWELREQVKREGRR